MLDSLRTTSFIGSIYNNVDPRRLFAALNDEQMETYLDNTLDVNIEKIDQEQALRNCVEKDYTIVRILERTIEVELDRHSTFGYSPHDMLHKYVELPEVDEAALVRALAVCANVYAVLSPPNPLDPSKVCTSACEARHCPVPNDTCCTTADRPTPCFQASTLSTLIDLHRCVAADGVDLHCRQLVLFIDLEFDDTFEALLRRRHRTPLSTP